MAKRRRRSRRNPAELMLLENPSFDYLGNVNPRRRHRRRNPMARGLSAIGIKSSWTQGVSIMDAAAAVAGLAGAAYIPSLVVKDTTTTTGKLLKVIAALGSTIVVGMALKRVAPGAARAAVIGGLAGTTVQALSLFTGIKVPGFGGNLLGSGGYIRRLGETTMVSPSMTREGETVTMIQP